jgi:glycosyltransferase involved in cell wall biosynthesis
MMSETTADDFKRVWWQEWIKKRVVALCSAGLVGGTPHRAYLRDLGPSKESIFLGYDAVDNDHFTHGAQQARQASSQVRERLDLPERYFLASNRFIPKKNLPRLIQGFAQYQEKTGSEPWDLVLLGDGPERARVEDAIDAEGVREAVHLPGFKQYDALPAYYGLAGAFVHASIREQWGLVVNEAMAAGLPVLVSNRCGCASDLVTDGTNGYTFDPYDIPQLASLLQRLAHGNADRARMGDASREIIAEWGPDRFAAGLEKAAQVAVEAPRSSSSLLDTLILKALMYR